MNKLIASILISLGIITVYYLQCNQEDVKDKNFNIKIGCLSSISLFISFIILSNLYKESNELMVNNNMNDLLSGKINNIKPPF